MNIPYLVNLLGGILGNSIKCTISNKHAGEFSFRYYALGTKYCTMMDVCVYVNFNE